MPERRLLSKFVRRTHLLVALFLTPWITMYGLSTLVMHHREFFTGHERRIPPEYVLVREEPYELAIETDQSAADVAENLLAELGIEGSHSARGNPHNGTLTIDRHRAFGSQRILYDSRTKALRIEKQRFGLAFFLEMLHRRRSFEEAYLMNDLWAVSVDAVILAIVLWALTGVWMWFEMSKTRKLGTLCLFGGSALFSFFLIVL